MADRGRVWSESETIFLEIRSEREIQQQLLVAVSNPDRSTLYRSLNDSITVADVQKAVLLTVIKSLQSSPQYYHPHMCMRAYAPSPPHNRKTNERDHELRHSSHFNSHLDNKHERHDVIDRNAMAM